jgi:creatinine amidohydrolase
MKAVRNLVSQLTWKDVSELLAQGAAAILPIGAGAKQHGLHMPMATDEIQAKWFAQELARTYDALVWPALTYGYYPAFVAYAGSVSLTKTSFEAVIAEITQGLLTHGVREVWILNTGLTTVAPVERALSPLNLEGRVLHLPLYSGPQYRQVVSEVGRQQYGSHADEIETSIMLAIDPGSVRMPLAEDSPALRDGEKLGPLTPIDHGSPNFSASGSFGRPTLASAAKGRLLVQAILSDLTTAIEGQRKFPA